MTESVNSTAQSALYTYSLGHVSAAAAASWYSDDAYKSRITTTEGKKKKKKKIMTKAVKVVALPFIKLRFLDNTTTFRFLLQATTTDDKILSEVY